VPANFFEIQIYIKSPVLKGQSVPANQAVSIGTRVKNISSNPVWIVGVLDGSEAGLRYPHYLPKIEGPSYEELKPEWSDFTSPLRMKDFLLLQPGEDFDPTVSVNGAGYLPLVAFRDFIPPSVGRYHLSLSFLTESVSDEQWLGTIPDASQNESLRQVEKVPHCKVVSNMLIVDVC
jgi:hypothetical protein